MQLQELKRPTKSEQKLALASLNSLDEAVSSIKSDTPEIEIEETGERIKIPLKALTLLTKIVKAMSEGKPISLVPVATELTTQKAAEYLGCSRPHVINLLEEGKIPYTLVGRHRRIKYEDVLKFKKHKKEQQKKALIELMKADEEDGLYDT